MTPNLNPFPAYPAVYSRRRSKQKMIEQMQKLHEQWETMALDRQFKMQELLQKLDESGMPAELLSMMKIQLEMLAPPIQEAPSLEKLKSDEMEQLSDRFSGIYIQRNGDSFKSWNFAGLLAGEDVTAIEFDAGFPRAIIYAGDKVIECLEGVVAINFVRYLHYTGIFELEAAKKPCPECRNKPPQDCETCGGLGWVL